MRRAPRVAFSRDGTKWTTPRKLLAEDHWLWRVTWHQTRGYGTVYQGKASGPELHLVSTTDGIRYERVHYYDGNDNLVRVDELIITLNSNLVDIGDFPDLTSVGSISITNNDKLESLSLNWDCPGVRQLAS